MKIIVGLGNPGEQYKKTRHNIAWLAFDHYLGEVKWQENKKFNALTYQDGEYIFVKPMTFMNNSGQSIQKILNYYKLLPKNFGVLKKKNADLSDALTLVHDDLDLDFSTQKIAVASGSAGHRGVQSTINYLKTKNFKRIRLGIKNELLKTRIPAEKFVLQPFNSEEKEQLETIFSQIDFKA